MSRPRPWTVIKRQLLFRAEPWIDLSVQTVQTDSGKVIEDYYQLDLPSFVVIFAQTCTGKVIVIRQYKHGLGHRTLTLPGGYVEPGESSQFAAERELLEETGHRASQWRSLGSFVVNGNLGAGHGHFFAASDARRITRPRSGDLEKMEIEMLSRGQIRDALSNGDVGLLNHAAAISLALLATG